jgi:hypothetical protein
MELIIQTPLLVQHYKNLGSLAVKEIGTYGGVSLDRIPIEAWQPGAGWALLAMPLPPELPPQTAITLVGHVSATFFTLDAAVRAKELAAKTVADHLAGYTTAPYVDLLELVVEGQKGRLAELSRSVVSHRGREQRSVQLDPGTPAPPSSEPTDSAWFGIPLMPYAAWHARHGTEPHELPRGGSRILQDPSEVMRSHSRAPGLMQPSILPSRADVMRGLGQAPGDCVTHSQSIGSTVRRALEAPANSIAEALTTPAASIAEGMARPIARPQNRDEPPFRFNDDAFG